MCGHNRSISDLMFKQFLLASIILKTREIAARQKLLLKMYFPLRIKMNKLCFLHFQKITYRILKNRTLAVCQSLYT